MLLTKNSNQEKSQLTGQKKHDQGALSSKLKFAYLIYEHLR